MKTLPIIFIFVFALCAYSQDETKPEINKWRGLVLSESTFEDAKTILGEPLKIKENQTFRPLVYSKWFGNKILKFSFASFKVEGFDKVFLYFKDNKLVVIEFDMKKDLAASALVDAYQSEFYPMVGNYGKGISPSDLESGSREIIYPDKFPMAYYLASANNKAIGLAMSSTGFGESLVIGLSSRTGSIGLAALPGIVRKMQLISRTLENKAGTDLLK